MSVIVSRALPEIDGFKPAHRKLLYTMYEMGLLTRATAPRAPTSSAAPMHLNPHGDAAIYDTMVRLRRANESLLVPVRRLQGQLRQGVQPRYGLRRRPLHRGQARAGLRRAVPRHRQGHRRLCAQLRRHDARSRRCCPSHSRRFSQTTRWASPSAWRPISAPSIWKNSATRRSR